MSSFVDMIGISDKMGISVSDGHCNDTMSFVGCKERSETSRPQEYASGSQRS
jgi:hypothetical protein